MISLNSRQANTTNTNPTAFIAITPAPSYSHLNLESDAAAVTIIPTIHTSAALPVSSIDLPSALIVLVMYTPIPLNIDAAIIKSTPYSMRIGRYSLSWK